jgi:uncharacterized membrane protein YbaN (DUF454 family)
VRLIADELDQLAILLLVGCVTLDQVAMIGAIEPEMIGPATNFILARRLVFVRGYKSLGKQR